MHGRSGGQLLKSPRPAAEAEGLYRTAQRCEAMHPYCLLCQCAYVWLAQATCCSCCDRGLFQVLDNSVNQELR